ncbi:MAG: DUF6231 family protein [Pseudomonadota bacterium]
MMINDVLSLLGATDNERLLIIGVRATLEPTEIAGLERQPNVSCISELASLEDLPSDLGGVTLALLLFGADAEIDDLSVQLLGRLRDSGVARVAVNDPQSVLTVSEMLALGYVAAPGASGRIFLHDPDEFFSRREWNNARHWANPENFKRYRW